MEDGGDNPRGAIKRAIKRSHLATLDKPAFKSQPGNKSAHVLGSHAGGRDAHAGFTITLAEAEKLAKEMGAAP